MIYELTFFDPSPNFSAPIWDRLSEKYSLVILEGFNLLTVNFPVSIFDVAADIQAEGINDFRLRLVKCL